MSEFQITTLKAGEIVFDVEEAKQRIMERVAGLDNMVVTEDGIKDAKELRADIINEYNAGYTIKEVAAMNNVSASAVFRTINQI